MIVVDSSAVVAIFLQQPDAARHARCIADDDQPLMSAANVLETSIVLRTLKRISPDEADGWLDEFLAAAEITVEPVTVEQSRLARAAHARYGKGGGGPAHPLLSQTDALLEKRQSRCPVWAINIT